MNSIEMIGDTMYEYLKTNGMKVNGKCTKLLQVLDTKYCGGSEYIPKGYTAISSYYLWFLIDFGYIIDDILSLTTFTKHSGFNSFTEEHMKLRQEANVNGNKGMDNFYKLCLNSSYGQEILNEEKFTKLQVCNAHQTLNYHLNPNSINTRVLSEDTYRCGLGRSTYG
jgi:hypothetical protein